MGFCTHSSPVSWVMGLPSRKFQPFSSFKRLLPSFHSPTWKLTSVFYAHSVLPPSHLPRLALFFHLPLSIHTFFSLVLLYFLALKCRALNDNSLRMRHSSGLCWPHWFILHLLPLRDKGWELLCQRPHGSKISFGSYS